ncbi:amidohydrolase family protein [Sphingopyxis sp. MSC1_008]|jgi:imidazolonepropionase-like amidohydrolase|uniref:amidohydrolase family protein n=1 Tax=Sphingopyxis sp. MSC1_008 TaxID=2909265 RepID=UPI0020BE1CA4|nr:amidohydrolase family protein [Sphingopyxis sp. MSC1_008]
MIRAVAIVLALTFTTPAAAQTVAITGGRVVTMGPAGEIERGTVVITGGRIVAVGADVAVPPSAKIVDATGKIVTPGLVAAGTALGLIEVRAVETTDDRATDASDVSAAFDAGYGLNPDSLLIPVARLGGITRAITTPAYKDRSDRELLFAGQAAAVVLDGRAMLMKRGVAMVLDMGDAGAERAGGARAAELVALRALFAEVRDYRARRAAYDRGETRDYTLSRADMDALIPVVEGRMPLLVSVNRAADIRDALALGREEGLKLILESASEGWRVADEIAAAGVPVLLTPVENTPASFEMLGATLTNAARLAAAGVTIAIEGNDNHREREMRYNAGNAAANGLDRQAALAAITINPARIFGLADRIGSLEAGKEGDVVIWDGDPLDTLARPTAVFIRGAAQPMTSRATELRDRYLPAVLHPSNGETP